MSATMRVAVVLQMLDKQPWGGVVKHDIESALATYPDISVEFAVAEGSASDQVAILERFLAQRVKALIVLPIDPNLTKMVLEKYRAANVPVIVLDTDVGDPNLYRALILADNRQFGREVGEFFVKAMGSSGDIVEISGIATTRAATERSVGFREVLAPTGLRVIETCAGDWMYDQALREFTDVLWNQTKIDGVFAHNDEMARAALDAATRAGRADEMLITGIDALPSSIRLVTEGRLAATFLNPSPGKQAVHALLAILSGEPCLKRTLLHTSPLQSNVRVRAWQEAHKRSAPTSAGSK